MKKRATFYKLRAIGAALLCLAFFAGCEDEASAPPPAKPAKKKVMPKADATPKTAAPSGDKGEYARPEYPNAARRNPFQPDPDVIVPTVAVNDGEVRTRGPLEQYGLGELALVAIISETAVPKAMFIDRDGFGHVVKEGDRIGRNGGVISDIRDNEVEVLEGNDEEDGQTFQKIVKLREIELTASSQDGLTEDERAALKRLLETEAGRKAVGDMQNNADGKSADQSGQQKPQTGSQVDPRYKGFAPPK